FSGWQLGTLRRRVARPLAQPRRTVRDSSGIFAAAPGRSANIVVGISRTRLQPVLGRLACSIRLERVNFPLGMSLTTCRAATKTKTNAITNVASARFYLLRG